MTKLQGGCLCGAVRYECDGVLIAVHCHCIDCRKSSGTSHCTHVGTPKKNFRIRGEVKSFDKPADSGNVVRRNFCPKCGSPVYSTNAGIPGMIAIRAGSLDDPELFKPGAIVYTKRELSWSGIDAALPRFEELPPQSAMPVFDA